MTHQDPTNPSAPGSEARADAENAARRVADDAKSLARDAATRARSEAESRAESAKDSAASEISGIADGLRKAAESMRSGSPQERTFGQIAESLADASDAVRDRDIGELASEVSNFARRNPLAFLGGAALAGFAVTRFAKAGTPQPAVSSPATTPATTPAATPVSGGITQTPASAAPATGTPAPGGPSTAPKIGGAY
ncbi:hypothetical protein [Pacificitalea manganoxidans]|uniref:hypothetical protein n=1 Tax=Pacificitalea manganoxidans TaxID=1411902 RepID=UPI000B520248|nr:hypothetical protein [Pacificitalea manganoxidans]MDR6307917.1 uncharacterized protein YjbJ (UPF0337 family) [Pacificitalea manganoxidans]